MCHEKLRPHKGSMLVTQEDVQKKIVLNVVKIRCIFARPDLHNEYLEMKLIIKLKKTPKKTF